MNWKEAVCYFGIGILKGTLEVLEKSKKKKCRCNVDSKYGKTLKRSNKNNKPNLLEGLLISDIKTSDTFE